MVVVVVQTNKTDGFFLGRSLLSSFFLFLGYLGVQVADNGLRWPPYEKAGIFKNLLLHFIEFLCVCLLNTIVVALLFDSLCGSNLLTLLELLGILRESLLADRGAEIDLNE